jgi:hypothetical protein
MPKLFLETPVGTFVLIGPYDKIITQDFPTGNETQKLFFRSMENGNVSSDQIGVCQLCVARLSVGFSGASDAQFSTWRESYPDESVSTFCPLCFGILQFGGPVFSSVSASLAGCGYEDIFSVILAIQFPPLVAFRSLVERLVFTENTNPAGELKDVLRGFFLRSVSENPNDRLPKLLVDVQFQAVAEYVIELHDGVERKVRKPNMLSNPRVSRKAATSSSRLLKMSSDPQEAPTTA